MVEQQASSNSKKNKAFVVVGTIVVVGLILGWFYSNYRKTHVTTDDAFIQGDIHTIAARVSGSIEIVAVDDNQHVKKGTVLVQLDPTDYRSKVMAARANTELQRANLRQADRELKRARALYEQDASSADRFDKALSAKEIAAAKLEVAMQQLRQAELNLDYTKITAPADGYVTRKSAETGNRVQVGQPLMAIVNLDNIYVVANYKETELERIRPGQRAQISVDAYPGKVFRGTVDSIMAGTGVSFSLFPPENATGNYVKVVQRVPVKIVFEQGEDNNHLLKVGMSVVPTVTAR